MGLGMEEGKSCDTSVITKKQRIFDLPSLFFSPQERGVGAFPPNFVVTTMMDVAAVRAHDKNPIMCSSCEDKLTAAARCIECMDFLCHDCRNAHMRLRLTKSHRVSEGFN